jgi:hypothetical protein
MGDVWLIVSGAMRLSQSRGAPVFLSRYAYRDNSFEPNFSEDFGGLISQCLQALELEGSQVVITDQPQNQHQSLDRFFVIPHSAYYCTSPPLPTKAKRHHDQAPKQIAVQIESRVYRDRAYRDEIPNWLSEYRNCDQQLVLDIYRKLLCLSDGSSKIVGKHQGPLGKSIEALCESTLFIGIDSGMSHIASSVGVPVYLLEWTHGENPDLNVHMWHKNKGIKTFKTFDDFLGILETHGIN